MQNQDFLDLIADNRVKLQNDILIETMLKKGIITYDETREKMIVEVKEYLIKKFIEYEKIQEDSIRRKIDYWVTEYPDEQKSISDKNAIEICFALGLDLNESNKLLCKLNLRKILPLSSWNTACYYCLKNNKSYEDAIRLNKEIQKKETYIMAYDEGFTNKKINEIDKYKSEPEFIKGMKEYLHPSVSRTHYKAFVKWSNYLLLIVYDYRKNIKKEEGLYFINDISKYEEKIMNTNELDKQLEFTKKLRKKSVNEVYVWKMITGGDNDNIVYRTENEPRAKRDLKVKVEVSKKAGKNEKETKEIDLLGSKGLLKYLPNRMEINRFKKRKRFSEKQKELSDYSSLIQDWMMFIMLISYYVQFMILIDDNIFAFKGKYWPYTNNAHECINKMNEELEKSLLPKLDEDVRYDCFIKKCIDDIKRKEFKSLEDSFGILKDFIIFIDRN